MSSSATPPWRSHGGDADSDNAYSDPSDVKVRDEDTPFVVPEIPFTAATKSWSQLSPVTEDEVVNSNEQRAWPTKFNNARKVEMLQANNCSGKFNRLVPAPPWYTGGKWNQNGEMQWWNESGWMILLRERDLRKAFKNMKKKSYMQVDVPPVCEAEASHSTPTPPACAAADNEASPSKKSRIDLVRFMLDRSNE